MKSPLPRRKTDTASCALTVSELKQFGDGWILDSEYRQLSAQTLYSRRNTLAKLLWWLAENNRDACGTVELRGFLTYVSNGPASGSGGRWGKADETAKNRPVTAATYHSRLRTFFAWLVEEGYADDNPIANLKPPIHRADQIQPFTEEQVANLLASARKSKHPRRDEAILLLLLDTGMRASELCDLRVEGVDVPGKKATVLGKGNKHRTVFFSRATGKALWQYIRAEERQATGTVFRSERGDPLTRSGLLQLVERLGTSAGLEAVRCSPHTFRHTAAVWFLRNGGQVFALKEMLGHEDLKVTSRYVLMAQADVQNQHRLYSPVERLSAAKGGRK